MTKEIVQKIAAVKIPYKDTEEVIQRLRDVTQILSKKNQENSDPQLLKLLQHTQEGITAYETFKTSPANDNIPFKETQNKKGSVQKFLKFLEEKIKNVTNVITKDPLVKASANVVVKAFHLVKTLIESAIKNCIAAGEFAGALYDFSKAAGHKLKDVASASKELYKSSKKKADYIVKKLDAGINNVSRAANTASSFVSKIIHKDSSSTSRSKN